MALVGVVVWAGCGRGVEGPSGGEAANREAGLSNKLRRRSGLSRCGQAVCAGGGCPEVRRSPRPAVQSRPGAHDTQPVRGPADAAAAARNEQSPVANVTPGQFAELMKKVEQEHGTPLKIESLSVFSTDPTVLGRQSKEELDALDSLFAIGAMPDSIPLDIRKASVRGQIRTQLSQSSWRRSPRRWRRHRRNSRKIPILPRTSTSRSSWSRKTASSRSATRVHAAVHARLSGR